MLKSVEARNQASVTRRGETHEDHLAQMLVDMQEGKKESSEDENSEESKDESRDIDLMARDDEEEEEKIEPETKEDRAFLDDEVVKTICRFIED